MTMLDEFLEEKTKEKTEKSAQVYRNFYYRVKNYFPENKSLSALTKKDFAAILSCLNVGTMGNFVVSKSNIKDYLTWMAQRGANYAGAT